MNSKLAALVENIRALEKELETELSQRREALRYQIANRKIIFDQAVLREHKKIKENVLRYIATASPRNALSVPFIFSLFIPIVVLDVFVSIYQSVCFRLYRIPKVERADHFVYDRRQLAYLNILEKINCTYCSYATGFFSYVREIAARTEQYWCPIKHARGADGRAHSHYHQFLDYGDAKAYREELEKLRLALNAVASTEDFGTGDGKQSQSGRNGDR